MWTRIIKYENFSRFGVQWGARVEDSKDHKLFAFILGKRQNRFIFRLDKMLLNYFFNKNLIHKIAARGGNFLFLTLRKEYYDAIRENSDRCFQTALLWQPSLLGNLDTRSRIFEKSYDLDFESFKPTDVFVLFDNQKFRSTRIMKEIDNFPGVPLISVLDTDSIMLDGVFPIVGNDDSSIAIYFYSLFVSYSIGSSGKIMSDFVDD